jgi:hypothetical protein
VIAGAAFCPHPPMLVPALASGAAAELDGLRAACVSAISSIAPPGRRLVLLGSGPRSAVYSDGARGSLAGYGVDIRAWLGTPHDMDQPNPGSRLPLSLTIGAWLVERSVGTRIGMIGVSVGPDFETSDTAEEMWRQAALEEVALVIMGDGSTCRSTGAPGYLDGRAAAFDATVATALHDGDAAALAGLDPRLGAELLAAGVPAWRAAGVMLAGTDYVAQLCYDAAPYGVGYLVGSWTGRG